MDVGCGVDSMVAGGGVPTSIFEEDVVVLILDLDLELGLRGREYFVVMCEEG